MIGLEQFKENAQKHGICEMLDDWNRAKSKKQLMDIALNVRGIEYLSESIAQGWGISPDVIAKDFQMFNNGKYTYNKGYTSQMYCLPPEDEIHISTTVALVIGFNGVIVVDSPICEIYIVNSNCSFAGDGLPYIYAYNSRISHPDKLIHIRKNVSYGA